MKRLINLISQAIIVSFLILVLVTTLLSLFFSYFLPRANYYRDDLLAWLNQQNPGTTIQAERITGHWNAFHPSLELFNVHLSNKNWESELTFSKLTVQFDIFKSLKREKVIFSKVLLSDLSFSLLQLENGQWTFSTDNADKPDDINLKPIIKSLWSIEHLQINDFKLRLKPYASKAIDLPELYVQGMNYNGQERLIASLKDHDRDVSIFVADAWGEPYTDDFKVNGYLQVKNYQSGDILSLFTNASDLEKANINMNLWFDWKNTTINAVADLAVKDIAIQLNQGENKKKMLNLEGIETKAKFKYHNGESEIWLPKTRVLSRQGNLVFDDMYIKKQNHVSLYLRKLDLDQVNTFVNYQILPEKVNDILKTLHPEGVINNLYLYPGKGDFTLHADLYKTSIKAWKAVPELESVSGKLSMHKNNGTIDLNTQDFSIFFPYLYDKPQQLSSAQGKFQWGFDKDWFNLMANNIKLSSIYGQVAGEFYLQIPLDNAIRDVEPGRLSMELGLLNGNAKDRDDLIPDKKMPENLMHWLDTQIHQGVVNQAGFIFHGPLSKVKKGINEETAIQLWLDVSNGSLSYLADLPAVNGIDGEVLLDNNDVFANVRKATSAQLSLNNTRFSLVEKDHKHIIDLTTDIGGKAKAANDFLNQPVIAEAVDKVFDTIHFDQGTFDGKFHLKSELSSFADNLDFSVKSNLRQFNLLIPEHNIEISNIFGDIDYTSKKGLSSRSLTGRLFDHPIKASIKTSKTRETHIQFNTRIGVSDINAWHHQPALTFFKGTAPLDGDIVFDKTSSRLNLKSDLVGISSSLPSPLGKIANEKKAFNLLLPLKAGTKSLVIDYGNVNLGFLYEGDHLQAGQINFGKERQNYQKDKFIVGGQIPYVNLSDWLDSLKLFDKAMKEQPNQNVHSTPWKVAIEKLSLGKVFFHDVTLKDMLVSGQSHTNFWRINVKQPFINGQFDVYDDERKPMQIHLDRLDVDGLAKAYKAPSSKGKIDLDEYPSMAIQIKQLIYKNRHLGTWSFATYANKKKDTLIVTDIRGDKNTLKILPLNKRLPAELSWHIDKGYTKLQGLVKGDDFSEVLTLFGFDKEITSQQYTLSGQIQWSGAPSDFSMKSAYGETIFDFQNGSFTDIESSSAKAIQVIGILNVSYLLKRLQLDFSDLTKKGFTFGEVKGGATLNKGVLRTDGPIVISSASSNIRITGSTNLNDDTLDLNMSITLPLASNIPWIATLIATGAAGLWPAAGVFLVSHLFKSQVNKLSTFMYHIKGSIQNPSIQFKKIFDDGDQTKSKQGDTKKQ